MDILDEIGLKQNKTADKKKYIREYMKKRYDENTEEARAYARSIKCKKRFNISNEEFKKYGKYLCDIQKLKAIKSRIPSEMFNEVCIEGCAEIETSSENSSH